MYPEVNSAGFAPNGFDQSMYSATPTQACPGFDNMFHQSQTVPQPPMSPNDWQMMQMQEYMMYQQQMQFHQNQSVMQSQMPSGDWYGNQNPYMHNMFPGQMPFQQSQDPFQSQMQGSIPRNHMSQDMSQYASRGDHKSLFNPQTRSFVPNDGKRKSRQKKGSHNSRNLVSHTNEDSLKQKYGAPASLPKKPPPPIEKRHEKRIAPEVIDTARIGRD